MNEEEAREVLSKIIVNNDNLYSLGWLLLWNKNDLIAYLDGEFTARDLEAIAWWMNNKKEV